MKGYQVRVFAIADERERSQFFPNLDDATKHFNDLVTDPTWEPEEGDHVVILKIVDSHQWS